MDGVERAHPNFILQLNTLENEAVKSVLDLREELNAVRLPVRICFSIFKDSGNMGKSHFSRSVLKPDLFYVIGTDPYRNSGHTY